MNYRRLGESDLLVSEIGLGSWLTYSGGIDKSHAISCIRQGYAAGVNLFDTANSYGRGAAENQLADALSEFPRRSYLLATKVFSPMSDTDAGLSPTQIRKQLHASLKRLHTDYIDIYQCHSYDPKVPIAETMGALTEAVREGKVRYIGVSGWSPKRIEAALAVPGTEKIVSGQVQYSLLNRGAERRLIPFCRTKRISQLAFSPLAQGLLTGKYGAGGEPPPKGSRAASRVMGAYFPIARMSPWVLTPIDRLNAIAHEAGMTLAQLALAWVLRQHNVASALVGATHPDQIVENVAASGLRLDSSLLARIEQTIAPALLPYRLLNIEIKSHRSMRRWLRADRFRAV